MIRRLGIIGDLHGEHQRLEALLDWFAGSAVDAVVCTGDVADGRGCINRSCELLASAGVTTVAGNHDRWLLNDKVRHLDDAHSRDELTADAAAYLAALPRWRELDTIHGRLLLCHGVLDNDMARVWPGRSPDHQDEIRRSEELDGILERGEHRYLVNGHMHFRILVDFEALTLLNAGTVKGPHAGVSIMDFAGGSVSAYSIADEGTPKRLIERSLDPAPEKRRVWRHTAEFDGDWAPATLYASEGAA
ncbi:MAG: metallophosphoesterase [Pseudomonadota bacterium]